MTDTLLQKLEEKTMNILAEVEKLRGEIKHLRQENSSFRTEKEANTRKLQDLMGLLDSTSAVEVTSGARPYLQEEVAA